jgi:soluble lytic murein transglycosylase
MVHGQWRECTRGFEKYARAHPTADDVLDARRSGGLCALLDGDAKAARTTFEHLVDDEPDPLASARMADMAALSALRDGDRTHAMARWTDVSRSRPLSWAALVGRARLAEAKVELPPAIESRPRAGDAGDVDASFRPGSGGAGDADADPPADVPPPLTVAVPPPADFLVRVGLDGDAEIALRDRESAVTSGVGARAPEALCAAYGQIGRARRRYQIAQALPSALFVSAPVPRTRWAWECAFPSPYADVVRDAEANENLPRGLLWAVMRQESAFDPDAVSPAHAVGLMQLMPETARPIAEELALPADDARLTSPSYAIRVAARLLHKLINQFHGDVVLAVAAYNGGAEAVERWLSRSVGMQMDTFVERIPYKETRDYVTRVMGNLARYGYLALGEEGVPHVALELKGR